MLPGLLVSVLLLAWFGRLRPRVRQESARPPLRELRPVLRPLTLLYFAVVARSAVSYGFMTFLPLYLSARGYDLGQSGIIVSLYLLLGATGGFLGGWMVDRWGGRLTHNALRSQWGSTLPCFVSRGARGISS